MSIEHEIREEFRKRGLSISDWARINGFSTSLVYQVLSGRRKALRGESHKIAVLLGLKEGVISEISDLNFTHGVDSKRNSNGSY